MNMDRRLAILMGLGLVLIPIQRVGLAISISGFGLVLVATACIIVLRLKERNLIFGPRYVYIPLTVIVLSMLLSECDWTTKMLGVSLFAIYIAGINLKETLWLLRFAVLVGCISIVVYNMLMDGRTGGIYQTNNYNIALGAIMMGTVMFGLRRRWILATVVVSGLLFTGAEEALIAMAVLGLVLLVRRDWSKRTLLPAGLIVLLIVVGTLTGLTHQLWSTMRVDAAVQGDMHTVVSGRLDGWKMALTDIRPLGHGYSPLNVSYDSVHNVPLRILYEVGPLAAACWVFVMVSVLAKSKRKYIPAAIIGLSLVDHFMWTQLCIYTFVALGIAMQPKGESDLVFRSTE